MIVGVPIFCIAFAVIFVADFNNDNLSDILILPGGSNDDYQRDMNIYYSSGNSFTKETISNDFMNPFLTSFVQGEFQFDYGDFNGDGINDILFNGQFPGFPYELKYINKDNEDDPDGEGPLLAEL